MKTIVRTTFGSHLYGTNTPESDTDRKAVHLPCPIAILLHQDEAVIKNNTKEGNGKNTSDDVDDESFALHKFFDMLGAGNSTAIEMMFTPSKMILEVTPEWRTLVHHRDKFLTKNVDSALHYIKGQASKYGVKGSRVATVRLALSWVEN